MPPAGHNILLQRDGASAAASILTTLSVLATVKCHYDLYMHVSVKVTQANVFVIGDVVERTQAAVRERRLRGEK